MKLCDWRFQADGAAPTLRIAEFGCGSGNVALPLAALLPQCRFTLVDRNAFAVQLAQQRAASAGLTNVDRFHACSVADVRGSLPRCMAGSLSHQSEDISHFFCQ